MTTGSEETRRGILDAAWRLLSAEGGASTRMSDIAKEARVSRQAIYLHFANRAELLIATTRHIDDVQEVDRIFTDLEQKSGVDRLFAFIDAWGNYIPVIHGGARTMLAGKDTDPDLHQAWQDRMDALRGACKSVIEELRATGNLHQELQTDIATDLLWSTLSVQQWEMLTRERGWSQQDYLATMQMQLKRVLINSQ